MQRKANMAMAVLMVPGLVLPRVGRGQAVDPPSDSVLAAISARGRMLAAYDQAAWHATDAVRALNPDMAAANTMLPVRQSDSRWVVHFARLSAAGDSLLDVYVATEAARPDSFVARRLPAPQPLSDAEVRAARALRAARADFAGFDRPFNNYVLPRADGGFWVYFLPAQTDAREFPHGADVRYGVAADGRSIRDRHQMHRALLDLAAPDGAAFGTHSVMTEDLPQDSDVFLVLARRPRLREIVVTEHFLYEVATDGSIAWHRR